VTQLTTTGPVGLTDHPVGPPKELLYRRSLSLRKALREIARQRALVWVLAERQLRARYKQALLGFLWAIITPIALMVVFTVLFDKIGQIETGEVPYALFSYVGLLPWGFFSGAVVAASTSIINNVTLINKIACPREVWPLSSVAVSGADSGLSMLALLLLFGVVGYAPRIEALWVPLITVVLLVTTIAASLAVAVLVVYIRDLRHGIPLLMQLGLLATPVAYGFDQFVPGRIQWVYSILNPLGPVIDSYRRTVLYGQAPQWDLLGLAALSSAVLFMGAYWLFKRMEAGIADVA
jgi:ABC-2 type transport system permease protein/lipopolysaccharide transport system permease protein